MKKLLVCLLSLCMMLTMFAMLGVTASAANPQATVTVGTVIYNCDTFEDAVKMAQATCRCPILSLWKGGVGIGTDGVYFSVGEFQVPQHRRKDLVGHLPH